MSRNTFEVGDKVFTRADSRRTFERDVVAVFDRFGYRCGEPYVLGQWVISRYGKDIPDVHSDLDLIPGPTTETITITAERADLDHAKWFFGNCDNPQLARVSQAITEARS